MKTKQVTNEEARRYIKEVLQLPRGELRIIPNSQDAGLSRQLYYDAELPEPDFEFAAVGRIQAAIKRGEIIIPREGIDATPHRISMFFGFSLSFKTDQQASQ